MCGVERELEPTVQATKTMTPREWDGGPQNKASGERFAALVDSGAADDVLQSRETQRKPKSEAGIRFRGAGGERIRNLGQRKLKVRMSHGHVAGSTQIEG